jgi:hypothetical protein
MAPPVFLLLTRCSARAVADALPATAREAELQALRLGSAGLAAAIAQVAELLGRGELDASHPWPAALVWRRVRDSRDVAALATDRVLAPLLEAPGAAAVLRVAAAVSGLPQFGAMADALQPDESDYLRPNGGENAVELIARHAGCTVAEVERAARRRRLRDAVPARGVEAAYHCPSGAHSWLGKEGVEAERCPSCGEPPARWETPPPRPLGVMPPRRALLACEARLDGEPPPADRGRLLGGRNPVRAERLADLRARYLAIPSEQEPWELLLAYGADRELVAEHRERCGLTEHEARDDWRDVRRELVGSGGVGYLTPLVQAQLSRDEARVRHERKRLKRMVERLNLQDL